MGAEPQRAAPAGIEFSANGLALLPPYVSLQSLTRWTARLLAATGAFAAISLGVEVSHLRLLLQPVEGEAARALARIAQSTTGEILLALRLGLFVATAGAFLLWIYQARANVRALGVRRPRFTRGASVGAFLVPGLNVVRPHAVLAELWKASDPAILDPFGWRGAKTPRMLRVWWSIVVAWAACATVAELMWATSGLVLGRLRVAVGLSATADVAACAAVALTWIVIHRVADAQQAKWQRVREGLAAGPAH